MTWRENASQRLQEWRKENPSTVAEMLFQRRLERQRAARQKRLEKALSGHPAVQTYRMEKQRRMA